MNEVYYLRLLDYHEDLICFYKLGGLITYANEAYCRFIGKTQAQLVGTKFVLPEDERAAVDKHLSSQKQFDKRLTLEFQLDDNLGRTRWIHWTQRAIFDEQGEVEEFISIGRDITERKLAEDELNAYLDRLDTLQRVDRELTRRLDIRHVLVMALDLCTRLSGATAGFIALLNDEQKLSMAEVLGGYAPDLGVPYLDPATGIVGTVIERRKPEHWMPARHSVIPKTEGQMAFPLISQDRLVGVLCLETQATEMFTTDIFEFLGLITRRIAVALDNAHLYDTSQRQLAELQELYAKVSRLEQLKTDMIRIAAHDLRNPIGVIMGYIAVIKMRLSSVITEQDRDFMERIQRAAERMERITKDILSLQRIEQSANNKLHQKVQLNKIITDVFEEYQEQAKQKSLDYHSYLGDNLLYVSGDQSELLEAISNLVSNAIKYTPEKGSIKLYLQTKDGKVAFKVEDNGYGIPDDMQQELFQAFYRAKTAETEEIEGTGLGLHLVKNIIERHGGQILFQSTFGVGSTFGFEIPLVS